MPPPLDGLPAEFLLVVSLFMCEPQTIKAQAYLSLSDLAMSHNKPTCLLIIDNDLL